MKNESHKVIRYWMATKKNNKFEGFVFVDYPRFGQKPTAYETNIYLLYKIKHMKLKPLGKMVICYVEIKENEERVSNMHTY